ncbi:MAG: PAS domain S-box protein [Chloroflexota bacterium]|nr:PAS domain S-box protein [Chloroflexota bacterium]
MTRSKEGIIQPAISRQPPAEMEDKVTDLSRLEQMVEERTAALNALNLKLIKEMTVRKRAEKALKATLADFRNVITRSADGVIITDREGRILMVNPAAEVLFHRKPGELTGTMFGFPLALERAAEIEIVDDSGVSAIVEMRTVATEWEGKNAYLATLRDITTRKQAEESLRQDETRLRLLLGQMPCLLWTTDTDLRHTSSSGAALADINLQPDQVVGMTMAEYLNTSDPQNVVIAAHRRALAGLPVTYEFFNPALGKTYLSHVEPLRSLEGEINGVIGVAFDITENKQAEARLLALSRRLVEVQENERHAIARELHDETGQSLAISKIMLDRAIKSLPETMTSGLREIQGILTQLIAQVREMSLNLRPSMLDDLGLLPTLLWHFERYTSRTGVQVNFTHDSLPAQLPMEIRTAAFRMVQEALNNVAKHAGVSSVDVRARVESGRLSLKVEDHGAGFDPAAVTPTSTGLNSMQERAYLLGGELMVDSSPGCGTCVTAELPLPELKGEHHGQETA